MPRRSAARAAAPDDLREYHEAPPALVRDMEQWLAVGDRRAAAARVRAWLVESYALGPAGTRSRRRSATRSSKR